MKKRMYTTTILDARPVSLHNIAHWYSEAAVPVILETTDIVREHVNALGINVSYFFETVVSQTTYENDGSTTLDVELWNRIDGCPSIPATKAPHVPANDNHGYMPYELDANTLETVKGFLAQYANDVQLAPVNVPELVLNQDYDVMVLMSKHMDTKEVEFTFGKSAAQCAELINERVDNCTDYHAPLPHMQHYYAYYVAIFPKSARAWSSSYGNVVTADSAPVYTGYVYGNLLYGCPVFFPTGNAQRNFDARREYLNQRENGVLPVELTDDEKAQVRAIVMNHWPYQVAE